MGVQGAPPWNSIIVDGFHYWHFQYVRQNLLKGRNSRPTTKSFDPVDFDSFTDDVSFDEFDKVLDCWEWRGTYFFELLSCYFALEIVVAKILIDGVLGVGRKDKTSFSGYLSQFYPILLIQFEFDQTLEMFVELLI